MVKEMKKKMGWNANMHKHHSFQYAILDCSDVKVTLSSRSKIMHEISIFNIFPKLSALLIITTQCLSELCPVRTLLQARRMPQ